MLFLSSCCHLGLLTCSKHCATLREHLETSFAQSGVVNNVLKMLTGLPERPWVGPEGERSEYLHTVNCAFSAIFA